MGWGRDDWDNCPFSRALVYKYLLMLGTHRRMCSFLLEGVLIASYATPIESLQTTEDVQWPSAAPLLRYLVV